MGEMLGAKIVAAYTLRSAKIHSLAIAGLLPEAAQHGIIIIKQMRIEIGEALT